MNRVPESSGASELQGKTKKPSSFRETGRFIWEVVRVLIISLAIIIPVRMYIAQPFFVHGQSMAPTYEDGEYLIIDEISYRMEDPKRGDVIVFRYPHDPSQYYIKRIVGLPSEEVQIERSKVTIFNQSYPDGITLDEPYLGDGEYTTGSITVKLGANEYYVLGDNRLKSSDSRSWGTLPRKNIIGKAWVRAWPLDRWSVLDHPAYAGF